MNNDKVRPLAFTKVFQLERALRVGDRKGLFEGAGLLREELEVSVLGNLREKFGFIVEGRGSGGYYTPFGRKKAFGEVVKELVVFDFLGKKVYWGGG